MLISRKIGAFFGGSRLAGLRANVELPFGHFTLSRAESTPMRVSSLQTEISRALTILDAAFERSTPPA